MTGKAKDGSIKFTGEKLKMVESDSPCDHIWEDGPGELDTLLVCYKCQKFKRRKNPYENEN